MTIKKLVSAVVQSYLDECFSQFRDDPPDSQFQRGYLAALVAVYTEALGLVVSDDINKLWVEHPRPSPGRRREHLN